MDQQQLHGLSLCAGGAGLDLGFELAVGNARTVCWIEWEAFAVSYLAKRIQASCLAPAPLWTDLRTFDGKPWRGVVDYLTAGYPCQPFSLAGKRRGSDDPRHLWPHVARIIGEVEPAICFLENVGGHLSLGFEQVAGELQAMGYRTAAGLFTAEEVKSTHKRERLFILAVADAKDDHRGSGIRQPEAGVGTNQLRGRGFTVGGIELADTDRSGRGEQRGAETVHPKHVAIERTFPPGPTDVDAWRSIPDEFFPAQSKVRLLADGMAEDRSRLLKLLGNGVVPLQAAYAFCSLWAALRF